MYLYSTSFEAPGGARSVAVGMVLLFLWLEV